MRQSSYWDNNGKHQDTADILEKLVPDHGSSETPIVEIFRLLTNAYYDLYNNGGGNKDQWDFVYPIEIHLNSLDVDESTKKCFLKTVKKFRKTVTGHRCFMKEKFGKSGINISAEAAINLTCELYNELKSQ